jgi:ABC-type phosphate transport system substrate-binding protein
MFRIRTATATVAVGLVASAAVLSSTPAMADNAPQEKDVVTTGSDILQTAYNFLADGYGDLPGYNTAGNRWRFINFDSSGDAQGRTAYTDPRLLSTVTGNGTVGENGVKYIKQSDVQVLNPTIALRAGQPLVVRPSGGGGGGRDAIINDYIDSNGIGNWIDVGRSPDPVDASGTANQTLAQTRLGTKLYNVQFGSDRQVIATAADTNAPATISAENIKKIYKGEITTWGQIPGYSGPGAGETIIPLTLPDDAGMWNTFLAGIRAANGLTTTTWTDADARSNPNSFNVQQNDPTAITNLPEGQRKNAIVPFPRSRATVVNNGYYTVAQNGSGQTNPYNGGRSYTGTFTSGANTLGNHRIAASASGIKLLGSASTGAAATDPYGQNFALRAIFRESDLNSTTPWQPGSTLNWVQALFYNPDGPAPFVRTPAGEALLTAAGVTPDYHVFGTDNAEIELD